MTPSPADCPSATPSKAPSLAGRLSRGASPILLGALLVAFCLRKIGNLDLWWHLASGRWIWEHGAVPRTDIFSHTIAGEPWVDVWWGYQLLQYLAFECLGLSSLIIFKTLFVLAAFVLAFQRVPSRHRGALLVVLGLLGILISQLRFHVRPTAVSFAFLAAYLWLLERDCRKRGRAVWLLPPLHLIWANLHGISAVGIVVILIYAFSELWRVKAPLPWDWDAEERGPTGNCQRLFTVAGLCLLASAATPHWLRGVVYSWSQYFWVASDANLAAALLPEHWSPFGREMAAHPYTSSSYWAFTSLALLSFILNWRELRLREVLLVAAFFHLFQSAMRNAVLFAIVAAPIAARNYGVWIESLKPEFSGRIPPWMKVAGQSGLCVLLAAMIWDVASGRYYRRDRGDFQVGFGIQSGIYPEGTTAFLKANYLQGNLFNDFDFGGYLIWHLHPQTPVSIDNRNFVYGEVAREYVLSRGRPEAFFRLVEKHGISFALLRHVDPANDALIRQLATGRDWAFLKCDSEAALFVRRNAGNDELVASEEGTAPSLARPIADERLKSPPRRSELWSYCMAMTKIGRLLKNTGRTDLAAGAFGMACADKWFDEATLAADEVFPAAFLEMAGLLATAQRYGLAIDYLEKARRWDQRSTVSLLAVDHTRAHFGEQLGVAYEKTGRPEQAEAAYLEAVATGEASARVYYNLGNLRLARRDLGAAIQNLTKAAALAPDYAPAHCNLGLAQELHGQPERAMECYAAALKLNPDLTPALNNLGRLRSQRGEVDKARALWQRSLKAKPDQPKVREWLNDAGT